MNRLGIRSNKTGKPLTWPTAGVTRVPYGVYSDPETYAREQERIFRGATWNFLCPEFEVAAPGDFRTTFIGETPVIVTRAADGTLNAMVNRCAHKGSLVCLERSGNRKALTCVYHSWSYDLKGTLTGVAFRHGINKKGGMPPEFDLACHGLRRLRVESFCGLVFGTFSEEVEPFEEYLGEAMRANFRRVAGRPFRLLGFHSQFLNNNWKLYVENVKDSYHASLLQLFFATFKLNRLSMDGGVTLDERGWHHISYSKMGTDRPEKEYDPDKLRAVQEGVALADPGLLERWDEFNDGITLAIQTVFPTFTLQQIHNSLALRLLVPRGPDRCELFWWVVGYEDDDERQHHIRLKQSNLIGPAGYVSMEDGCIGGFIQKGVQGSGHAASVMEMGGRDVAPSEGSRATETSVRGFWKGYRELMGV